MCFDVNAVVFDLDGTLLDTLWDLAEAVNAALAQNGLPQRTLEEVRNFVGNGIELLMIRAVPEGKNNPKFEETFQSFKSYYAAHCKDNTKPYAQIIELMEQLKARGIKMGIVSNKIDFAVKELDRDFFAAYTSAAIGEMEGIKRKPAPDTVYKALEEMGVDKTKVVYVGDSDVDIETAKNAGIPCISVTWGFRSVDELKAAGASVFAGSAGELATRLGL